MAVERRRFVVGLGERGPRIRFPAGGGEGVTMETRLGKLAAAGSRMGSLSLSLSQHAWMAMQAEAIDLRL
jgi:hypothetical protein